MHLNYQHLYYFWVIAISCVFGGACDDETSKTERIPQINLDDNNAGAEGDGGAENQEIERVIIKKYLIKKLRCSKSSS